jgi:AcrR family transcriptional regulator
MVKSMASRREQTTTRILDGAAAAFAKGGYAATSMEEIAAAAGVSKLLLYRDFAGKRELYQAVLDRTSGWLKERVPREASSESLVELLAAARRDPDGFTLLFRHAAREPEFAAYAQELADFSERGSAELLRDIEPDPVLRRWAAHVTVHNTYQMIIAWLEHGDPARDTEILDRIRESNRAVVGGYRRPR